MNEFKEVIQFHINEGILSLSEIARRYDVSRQYVDQIKHPLTPEQKSKYRSCKKAYYEKNKDKYLLYSKNYQQNERDQIKLGKEMILKAYQPIYKENQENLNILKNIYIEILEKLKEHRRVLRVKLRASNSKEYRRSYYEKNKEAHRLRTKKWRISHYVKKNTSKIKEEYRPEAKKAIYPKNRQHRRLLTSRPAFVILNYKSKDYKPGGGAMTDKQKLEKIREICVEANEKNYNNGDVDPMHLTEDIESILNK